jgi:hypothetical protein
VSAKAHSGWKLATTPSSRNRGMSAGSKSWMCARMGRLSRTPFTERAWAMASRLMRMARSPMAWMWIRMPAASSAATSESSWPGRKTGVPASAEPVYGARSAAVRASITPSVKSLAASGRK